MDTADGVFERARSLTERAPPPNERRGAAPATRRERDFERSSANPGRGRERRRPERGRRRSRARAATRVFDSRHGSRVGGLSRGRVRDEAASRGRSVPGAPGARRARRHFRRPLRRARGGSPGGRPHAPMQRWPEPRCWAAGSFADQEPSAPTGGLSMACESCSGSPRPRALELGRGGRLGSARVARSGARRDATRGRALARARRSTAPRATSAARSDVRMTSALRRASRGRVSRRIFELRRACAEGWASGA